MSCEGLFKKHKWSEYYPMNCDNLKHMKTTQIRMCLKCKKFEGSNADDISHNELFKLREIIQDKHPLATGYVRIK